MTDQAPLRHVYLAAAEVGEFLRRLENAVGDTQVVTITVVGWDHDQMELGLHAAEYLIVYRTTNPVSMP